MNQHLSDIAPRIREMAPVIRAEIDKATSILLHCHPSPDPDSVGSVLALKGVLEGVGKKVTVIKGDSEIPRGFMHFPGAETIVRKHFFEVDLSEFDLFIAVDSGSPEQISRYKPIPLPLPIRTVVIDHHRTNSSYGDVNLVEPSYPASAQILADLFVLWNAELTPEIALNLFMGLYTDTGGFKYPGTMPHTFAVAAELAQRAPGYPRAIAEMENSDTPNALVFQGLALSSITPVAELGGIMALSVVPYAAIHEKGLSSNDVRAGEISSIMRRVADWKVVGAIFEAEPQKIKVSFRSHDADAFDVSKLAAAIGGGGHRAAAGAVLLMPLEDARALIVSKAKELYNL